MTWKEFKEQVERLGLKDEDELWYIDIQGNEELDVKKDERHGWKAVNSSP